MRLRVVPNDFLLPFVSTCPVRHGVEDRYRRSQSNGLRRYRQNNPLSGPKSPMSENTRTSLGDSTHLLPPLILVVLIGSRSQ